VKVATYKLLSATVVDGVQLSAGLLIGDGTPYPFTGAPTAEMELVVGDVNYDPTTKGPAVDDRRDTSFDVV
jgi:hypothetical protein